MATIKKAKSGKSFPDLNKDGKITKADILKGRGVIAKSGSKIKKAQDGGKLDRILSKPSPSSTPKEKPVPIPPPAFPKKFSKPSKASKPSKPMMKSGGKMKTCKGGC